MYFILLLFSLKPYLFNKKKSFLYISVSFFSFFILVTLTLYFLIEILNVPYLRNVKELLFELNPAKIISAQTYIQMKSSSQANYPLFLISNGEIVDFILRSILRYFYFMFSPFPWDISTPKQIIGLLDPFIHIIFFIIIFQNFNKILQDEKLFFLLILYIALTFTYSFGVGNFAQGIRHKTKFIPILMLITSSFYLRAFKDFFVGPRFRNKIMKKIIK